MTDFGTDVSCTNSLLTGRLVSGQRLVAEALYRRYITPRGTLRGGEDEANYGLDLTELVGSVATVSDAAALEGRIRAEGLKDERVETIDVTVTAASSGASVSFNVLIEATTADGPFTLQIAASAVTVDLLGITLGTA